VGGGKEGVGGGGGGGGGRDCRLVCVVCCAICEHMHKHVRILAVGFCPHSNMLL
jgi:hypothetical protein